ncbi:hypothetical protein RM697_09265 [Ichthyenterobacterium sp. W332]|uniref:Uncharacterized protein n=1 Tax=Microcosmobacter mediterraneus TaxID=3075607 RepID=A0ABU2YLA6_9FLAO|nr:hypothetical protein [Ichthyenterobacterium sp. W332]MDT0558837.1 hypothetical protein [Ichthyenterobacterium sp. W332]
MKKGLIILLSLLLYSTLSFSQEDIEPTLLKADTTWFKESIKFPIGFAREIPYKGFGDLRFAPGFTKADHPELWSYTWAWCLDNIKDVTVQELEDHLELYFNGLLGLNSEENKLKYQSTVALFIAKDITENTSKFIGKIKTYDTRYTKKPLTLNVSVTANFCKNEKKSILVFRLSPKAFDHEVWQKLNAVVLEKPGCDF